MKFRINLKPLALASAAITLALPMANCSNNSSAPTETATREVATATRDIIFPASLAKGDTIAIVSPAGPIDRELIDKAAAVLRAEGFVPVVYPHAYGRHGYFSGTHDERYADLEAALLDPSVKAILCSRGGYGVIHNMGRLAELPLRENPKWIIGYSDISALHALMRSAGIASIHASMAKQIMLGPDDVDNAALLGILRGEFPTYHWPASQYNRRGTVTAPLIGGNLAVLADLINTPWNVFEPGTILFIEDIAEPVYKVERIVYQLKYSGILERLGGLIIGQFTDYKPDGVHKSMEAMIYEIVKDYDFPMAFGVPVGHVDHNVPLVESSTATLTVTPDGTTLTLTR